MSVQAQVLDFIRNPDSTRVERLALAVFAYQFAKIEPYREFCLSRASRPDTVKTIADIPAVSTAAFKHVVFSSATPERIFLTSGTTRGNDRRGRHFVADLQLYHLSAIKHLQPMLFADGWHPWMLALHPTADRMPRSSLSQMISWCIESFGGERSACCATPQQVDCAAALNFARIAERAGEPLCILSTTAALSALFEHLRLGGARIRLAAGSRLMDTGGAKGQAIPISQDEVLAMAQEYLAIAPEYVINEYGMTELCSQLYDATPFNCRGASGDGARVKIPPPWLKVFARDPATLRPLAPGEIGLLSFFDLANAGSVSALLTEDLGVVNADGAVRILGRIIASDPRGCALSIEQFARLESPSMPVSPHPLPAPSGTLSLTRERAGMRVNFRHDDSPTSKGRAANSRDIEDIASRLRAAAQERLSPDRIADALARACAQWRDPQFSARTAVISAASLMTGQSPALLGASLDALLAGFTADALLELARRLAARDRLIGFIMPGNVMGAGLHELAQALIGGATVLVKASSLEPLFFPEFRRTLAAIDQAVAARMEVTVWDRSDRESTAAMVRRCDRMVAFGDDGTIGAIGAIAGPRLVGFGSRISAAMLSQEAIAGAQAHALAAALARDVSLFDQRGCLSLHHLFIEASPVDDGCKFAEILAAEMAALARTLPPAANGPMLEMAAARSARENARWRRIGGDPVALWEGEDLAWTVIFDADACLQPSPLYRTVYVSTFKDQGELCQRLGDAPEVLEGLAIADPANRMEPACAALRHIGVSYLCAPGQLQSPPPSWAHGGGRFLRLMEGGDG